jgi:AAA15 family ATPase/GTPase
MITGFTVENYRSIDEEVSLSFDASMAIKDMDNKGYTFVANSRVLNVIAFFGANSSGKSNVFKAVSRMRSMILQSVRLNAGEKLAFDPFLLSDKPMRSTRFEIEFVDGTERFKYGFCYTAERIESEWLIAKYPKRSKKTLFQRSINNIDIDEQNFAEGAAIKVGSVVLNENRLLLSLAAQLGGFVSNRVIEWFMTKISLLSGLRDKSYMRYTREALHSNDDYRTDILQFIKMMDLGFCDVRTEQEDVNEMTLPKGLPIELIHSLREHPFISASTIHKKYNADGQEIEEVEFDIDEKESDGTKKLFNMAGPIVDTLKKGKTLFIDELDAQLHPLLTREIVNLFNRPESNQHGAQLIFTTHDTNLLSKKLLRRDQVLFVEKDRKAQTHLTPMLNLKLENGAKPRTDSNYEKNYLEGKYGAIPYYQKDFDGCGD